MYINWVFRTGEFYKYEKKEMELNCENVQYGDYLNGKIIPYEKCKKIS